LKDEILTEMHGKISQQNVSSVTDAVKELQDNGLERLSYVQVLSYSSIVWKDKQFIAELIAAEASRIIQTVNKRRSTFFSGKSEKGLLSGLFYLLSLKNKAMKTQREISRSLNTTDVTVRASYRKWLKEFPDLFSDLHATFAENEKTGFFIPSKHGKRRSA
jgi:transcription initiation factor TFIIIB Brf1 subunit/transcription initiation factor TFIIB